MPLGSELIFDETLSRAERMYIRIFGVPINGLRIRARRILPCITDQYKDILDAGCGQGIFTYEIARRFPQCQVTGMDIDEGLLQRNRRISDVIGIKNCRFENGDINTIRDKGKYDLILSVDNLEHIEDDENVLRQFFEALRSGGELILHVPALERRWLFFGWKENFHVEGHCRPGYGLEDICRKTREAGFYILEVSYTYGWLETVSNNMSYLITRAQMRNKVIYAFLFPILNMISYLGKNARPAKGAGILIRAKKDRG